ncbi:alpha/beta hydrolase fold domain-containing protein [Nesterenkonia sphaerica]|uniref:alpha/beta hydrolase fold domain-containing protein n=1 Tax=Nesterenkonia sphaerica TaxID=1804988 RepID=UPI001AA0A88F|nr:alpha/beta hydrolase fold domain-containing protein [Nesterenkonia sphaerica]
MSAHPIPPWDPELVEALAETRATRPAFSPATLDQLRRELADGTPGEPPPDLSAGGRVKVEERQIPGPYGAPDITVLILTPAEAAGTTAGIYYIHGGGMVMGTRRNGVESLVSYAAEGLATVVSVEYRLAPEHPHPAPVQDCYAGLVWTAQNASALGIEPARLLIAGTSAGGGLAAGTALMARDLSYPALSHQVLVAPMLDDRIQTPSSQMLDGAGSWDREENRKGWTALLGNQRGGPDVSPYAAAARAEDLSGLPRTYLDCGSSETFRDEVLDYAQRLSAAGVSVDLHMWGGGFHCFDSAVPQAQMSRTSASVRDAFLRRALAERPSQ